MALSRPFHLFTFLKKKKTKCIIVFLEILWGKTDILHDSR
jgi:hypothetical protein